MVLRPVNGRYPDGYVLDDPFLGIEEQAPAAPDGVESKVSSDFGDIAVLEDDGTLIIDDPTLGLVTDTAAIARRFYETHEDDFDSVIIFAGSNFPGGVDTEFALAFAFYQPVRNSILGTNAGEGLGNGNDLFDFGGFLGLGNTSRLAGMINMNDLPEYPIDFGTGGVQILGQELLHMVAAFVTLPTLGLDILGRSDQHWSFFMHTEGSVMEGNDWVDNGDGTFTTQTPDKTFSQLDEYLFGFRAAVDVDPTFLIENPDPSREDDSRPVSGVTVNGTRVNFSVQDIITDNGIRIPDVSVSPKVFRTAFILVVPDGELSGGTTASDVAKMDGFRLTWEEWFSRESDDLGSVDTRLTIPVTIPPNFFRITNKAATQSLSGTVVQDAPPPWIRGVTPLGLYSIAGGEFLSVAIQVDPTLAPGGISTTPIRVNSSDPTLPEFDVIVELINPPPTVVPDVVGLGQTVAATQIASALLTIGRATTAFSDTVFAGLVISQEPVGGASVPEGTPIDLVVSLGPPLVQVPNVIAFSQVAAQSALLISGLTVGTVSTAFDDTVAAGLIAGQNPGAGFFVEGMTPVALIVSLGPSATVPNVIGLSQSVAQSAFASSSLVTGSITTSPSTTLAIGTVLSQNPAVGTVVAQGSAVDIEVSLGAQVPDLTGLDEAGAKTALNSAGLALGTTTAAHDPVVARDLILVQSIGAGVNVDPGTPVDVVISLGPVLSDLFTADTIDAQLAAFIAAHGPGPYFSGDLLPVAYTLALVERVVMLGTGTDLQAATLDAYAQNLGTLMDEADAGTVASTGYFELLAILMMVSPEMQDALQNVLLPAVPIDLTEIYAFVACDTLGNCEAVTLSDTLTNIPYASGGDPDNNGSFNQDIFDTCGCAPDEFAALALVDLGASSVSAPGGGGGGGCVIATAAYGTPLAEELDILRDLRDRYLLDGAAGSLFVDTYYRISPPLADVIAQRPLLQTGVRWALLPVIGVAYGMLNAPVPTLLSLLLLLSALSGGAVFVRRRVTG
ncbi:MAG: PASTA domain-containing protein [Candidatus Hydrogenedentes bacterium]|nr:PASTA domain-containing protein [Candidatus Hydrogenedentota bacterium]